MQPKQMKAARKLIGMSQANIAKLAEVGISTLRDYERGARKTNYFALKRLQYVLECLGVEFLDYEDGSYGVALKSNGAGVVLRKKI